MTAPLDRDPEPESPASSHARCQWGAIVVLAAFLLIGSAYLLLVPGIWSVHSDSAMYLGTARNLARGQGYTFNFAPCIKYPPVYPLLLTAVYATRGEDMWALQAVGALCGILALALLCVLLRPRTSRWTALALVIVAATNTPFCTNATAYAIAGVPYAMFSLLTLWLAERATGRERFSLPRWLGVTLVAIVAMYTHLSGASLVPALAAGVLWAKGPRWPMRERVAAAALVCLLGGAAAGLWVTRSVSEKRSPGYRNLVTQEPMDMLMDPLPKLKLRAREWAATPLSQRASDFGWLAGAVLVGTLLLPGLVRGFRSHRGAPEFYVCAYFLITFVHGGMGGGDRYVAPVVPLLVYYGYLSLKVLGGGVRALVGERGRAALAGRLRWLPRAALAVVLLALVGPAVYDVIRGRHEADAYARGVLERELRELSALRQIGSYLRRHARPDAVLFPSPGGDGTLIHFVTGFKVARMRLWDRGVQILQSMVDQDADFVVASHDRRMQETLKPTLERFNDCFPLLFRRRDFWIYRIDKGRLRETLRRLELRLPP